MAMGPILKFGKLKCISLWRTPVLGGSPTLGAIEGR